MFAAPSSTSPVVMITTQERAMAEFVFVSEAARELREKHGVKVRPHELTNLFYRRELSDDLCPIVGGRRLIPRGYLQEIADHLRSRGQTQSGTPK
jgi:hypothetical protein